MLNGLMRNFRLYCKLQLLQVHIQLEYRADFWIGIVGMALTQGAGLIFIWAVFQRVPHISGWTIWEIALLYSLTVIPKGLTELFFDGQWQLRLLVNKGEFDRLLVRPLSPTLQVITQNCGIHGIGSVILGITILATAAHELNLSWSWWQYGFLLVTLVSAVVLIGSINYATNCIAFWDASANSAFPFLMQYGIEFAKYPMTLYGRFIQIVVTWILPFAFISYYPALILLGKAGDQIWLGYLSPLAGPIMALVASVVWKRGLSRYQGSGH
jgi:ABC-2 type transport system permease protein